MSTDYYQGADGDKAYDSYLMKRLLTYLRSYKLLVASALGLLLLVSVLGLSGPYLIKIAIDRHIHNKDMAGLTVIAAVYFLVMFLEFILRYWQIYLMQLTGQKVMFDLRRQLFSHLARMQVGFFTEQTIGGLISRLISDIEVLNEMFSAGLVAVFGDIAMLLGIMFMLLYMNWRLALVVFTVIPLIFYVTYLFRQKVRVSFRAIRQHTARISAFMQENLTGMSIIQVFNRQEKNFKQFDRLNNDYLEAYKQTIFYYAMFFPVVEFLGALSIALMLWYGGMQVIQKLITFGVLVAFIEYNQRFFRPIDDLMEKYNIFQSAMAAAERIFKLLDTPATIRDAPNSTPWPGLRQEISFQNLSFAYNGEDFILKDINLRIKKGEKLAVVGLTGSGKTTLVGLLHRFYEAQSGRVLLDGIDIRNISLHDLRQHTAVILQEPFIFSGSVCDNIRLGRTDIPMDKIIWAAHQANAHDFIQQFADGYRHELKERGADLSAGQKQLLTFARALVFDPQILILDEATSNIDSQTEGLIQDALDKILQDRTCIVIAHRLATIQKMERIIVMDKGQIKEEGNHQQLLQQNGLYAKLYRLQFTV